MDNLDTPGRVVAWYRANQRDLPWREAGTTPWGVLVSEVMSHQTPVARVSGPWRDWMATWPTPAALADASTADVLRAWGRLGYPRRALRLQDAAHAIVQRHDGVVPDDLDDLRALPGVGEYTASAVLAFAFGRRVVMLDTNVRRVLARLIEGTDRPTGTITTAERQTAAVLLPEDEQEAAAWSVAVMELGALVCTARRPACDACPVADRCAWLAGGRPESGVRTRSQAWHGTNRQCRGAIMAALRASSEPVPLSDIAWPDPEQLSLAARTLVHDGLATELSGALALPD